MTFESKMSVTDIDSLLSGYSTPELIYNKDNLEKYRLAIDKGVIDKMEVSFDSKKNIIQNIYYKYRNGTPMEGNQVYIDYEIFDLTSIPDKNLFDENKWLLMKDKPTGIGRLSTYTVQGE
jgi:hypothetical protein